MFLLLILLGVLQVVREISNNSLVVLILIAIFISVAGTWISLGKLIPITGYGAGASGTTTATVNDTVDITLSNSPVAFGNQDIGVYNSTSDDNPDAFNISNDGSVYINVTASVTSLWDSQSSPTSYYNISCRNETWWSCDDAHSNDSSSSNPADASATVIIPGLPFNLTNNSARVDVSICVPLGEAAGAKSSTITFTASKDFS